MKTPKFLIEEENLHAGDFLNGRERLSERIAKLLNNHNGPLRIGIYGKWGVGKTTLVNLIIKESSFWKKFIKLEIGKDRESFDRNFTEDVFFGSKATYVLWVILWGVKILLLFLFLIILINIIIWLSGVIIQSSNLNGVPIINHLQELGEAQLIVTIFGISGFMLAIFRFVFPSGQAGKINESINWRVAALYVYFRKPTLIIDDLDRLPPDEIPSYLMWVNKISGVRKGRVNVIICCDPVLLGKAITKSNSYEESGGEGYKFLEKMIDYPFFLSELEYDSKYEFWNKHKNELINEFKELEVIEGFIEKLPDNIRQIKRYFRFLLTMKPEFNRYENGELSLPLLFKIILYKLEYPEETEKFVKEDLQYIEENNLWLNSIMAVSKPEYKEDLKKKAEEYFGDNKIRFNIYNAVKSIYDKNTVIRYYNFDNSSIEITRKEFKKLLNNEPDKTILKLKSIFDNNPSKILILLSGEISYNYSLSVDSDIVSDKEKYMRKVEKIIYLIDVYLDSIDDFVMSKETLGKIYENLSKYEKFNNKEETSSIDHKKVRESINKVKKKLILKLPAKFVIDNCNDIVTKEVKNKYWKGFLERLDKEEFVITEYSRNCLEVIREHIFTKKSIKYISSLESNSFLSMNLMETFYNLIISDKKKFFKEKGFEVLFKKVNLYHISNRFLGSFIQDINEKIDGVPEFILKKFEEVYGETDKKE